jgi:Spy/CpxP family protein refolding chaperone
MLKILLIAAAVLGVVAIVGIAWANHKGYCSTGDYVEHVAQRVTRKLDLDEEQAAKLRGFGDRLRGLRSDWTERKTQMRQEIERLLGEPSLDRERATALLDERRLAMAERRHELVDAFADFTDSLHPEQRARLAELIAERMERRWGHPRWAH